MGAIVHGVVFVGVPRKHVVPGTVEWFVVTEAPFDVIECGPASEEKGAPVAKTADFDRWQVAVDPEPAGEVDDGNPFL